MLGKENTIRLSMLITLGIVFSSWILYNISNSSFESNGIGLQNKINASTINRHWVVLFTHFSLAEPVKANRRPRLHEEPVGKKSVPMHLLLQLSLVIGCSACPNETDESIK